MPKKILSIDDSRMVHMVVTKTLKPLNVEVLTAVNGQEGIEKAEREQPDLILLDATMPLMDGLEALGALKANPATKGIPVVMLSADSRQDDMEKARQLGVLTFIPKPFTGDALVAGLQPFLDLRQKAA
ncbi:MAG TPA: response regulator [Verrucomicrobiae bacterium]|jgi:CheY-like chemotaxis protein|nr:response regulator [Verrucomicrobiae bacterium]